MTHGVVPVRVYAGTLAALSVLLLLTVLASQIGHPAIGLAAALSIASFKALLIILYFMHVRYDSPIVRLAAGSGFLWLAILLCLSMSDLLTRSWPSHTTRSGTKLSFVSEPVRDVWTE